MSEDRFDALGVALLAPLDALRALGLRLFARQLAPLIAQPALRHAVFGGASIVAAFALTAIAPMTMLALAPLLLGVPHLVADVRYLVLRGGLLSRPWVVALVFAPLLGAGQVTSLALTGAVLISAGFVARGVTLRRVAVALLGCVLLALDLRFGRTAAIVFAHFHNVLALVLWWWLRPARSAREWVVPVLTATLAVALAGGALDAGTPLHLEQADDGRLSFRMLVSVLSPVVDETLSVRFVLLFAFGQAVHYTVWLRMIPDDLRGRRAPRSFSASFRALRCELGGVVLGGTLLVWCGLLAWAALDLDAAWRGYLQLATFHGPLELACAGLAFAERRTP